jgi:hypothetical protein
MAKGGVQTSETRIPEALERASAENLAMANEIGRIGYSPYQGPVVAGLSDQQMAALANTNAAASAFGLARGAAPTSPQGGAMGSGYSAMPLYEQALAGLSPAQRGAIESMMINPQTGAVPERPLPEVNISPRSRGKK